MQQDDCPSPLSPYSPKIPIKKQNFIMSHNQKINEVYTFSLKCIGKGGYGTVYKAKLKHPPFTQRVVKVIPKKIVSTSTMLQNEIKIMKKCDHPNIVKLYETFEDQKYLYLVLDLCEGGQLFDRLESQGNYSQDNAKKIFLQMVKTIKYLHLQKICHRDLKAENFLFTHPDADDIKLIDFGLAYEWIENMENEMKAEGSNKIVGTAYYVAPQVLERNYDQRCDIWSLGVLLYILVTAAPPFDGDTDQQIIEKIKKNQRAVNPQESCLSPLLRDLIEKMLCSPDKRITIDQIMDHQWIKKTKTEAKSQLKLNYTRLKMFTSYSKLKSVALNFIGAQLPEKQTAELSKLFKQVDINNDGFITLYELEKALTQQGDNPNTRELRKVLKAIDIDKNGKINYNEFIASTIPPQILNEQQYLQFIFKTIDTDHNGKISREQLSNLIYASGINTLSTIKVKMINDILQKADKNKDGVIDYQQFVENMKQPHD